MHVKDRDPGSVEPIFKAIPAESRNRRPKGERGSLSVEFALVMFLGLIPLMLGIFSVGWILNQYLELTNAVTVGAQYLANSRGDTSNPCTAAISAIYQLTPLVGQNITFNYTFTNNGVASSYTTTSECDTAAEATSSPIFIQGESVELIATAPCSSPFDSWLFPAKDPALYGQLPFACNLRAEVTQIIQ